LVAYLVCLPAIVSRSLSVGARRWIIVGAVAYATAGFLVFLAQVDMRLAASWARPLSFLPAPRMRAVIALHLALAVPPLIGMIVAG
jgi:hypothetical protein